MKLFQRRRRSRQRAEAASVGRPEPLVAELPEQTRVGVGMAMHDFGWHLRSGRHGHYGDEGRRRLGELLTELLSREWKRVIPRFDPVRDLVHATDGEVLDAIEAWFYAMGACAAELEKSLGHEAVVKALHERADAFRERVNEIFDDDAVAWQPCDQQRLDRPRLDAHGQEPTLAVLPRRYVDGVDNQPAHRRGQWMTGSEAAEGDHDDEMKAMSGTMMPTTECKSTTTMAATISKMMGVTRSMMLSTIAMTMAMMKAMPSMRTLATAPAMGTQPRSSLDMKAATCLCSHVRLDGSSTRSM